jgi:hypothetical protein
MAPMVDSYRFLDGVAKRVMQHWSGLRAGSPTPWTSLAKPLPRSKAAKPRLLIIYIYHYASSPEDVFADMASRYEGEFVVGRDLDIF